MSLLTDIANIGLSFYSANQTSKAAEEAARAQQATAAQAAQLAEFKPYSITTGYGSSYFDEPSQRAGYVLNPVYEAFKNQYLTQAAGVMDQLGSLDPQQAAAQYLAEQQGLLSPTRTAEDQALRARQLAQGRIGLGLSAEAAGAGVGGGMVNPDQFAVNRARALADAQMAAQAREQGQADIDRLIQRGSGLFSSGAGVEELGMKPLTMGADIGSRSAVGGANAGQSLLQGGMAAAGSNLAGSLANIQGLQKAASALTGYKF